jgi:glycine/D-amino acid oxidase-like deaminating enzyme
MDLKPKEGFDWDRLTWGRPDSVATVLCSHCSASLDDGEAPLIVVAANGWSARFCRPCGRLAFDALTRRGAG